MLLGFEVFFTQFIILFEHPLENTLFTALELKKGTVKLLKAIIYS